MVLLKIWRSVQVPSVGSGEARVSWSPDFPQTAGCGWHGNFSHISTNSSRQHSCGSSSPAVGTYPRDSRCGKKFRQHSNLHGKTFTLVGVSPLQIATPEAALSLAI
jgi:hypothetical protein